MAVILAADSVRRAEGGKADQYTALHRGFEERAYQPSPPTPMTVMGVQVRPTRTSKSWTTTPILARIPAAAGSEAFAVLAQHWTGAVEQEPAGSLRGAGVAAARVARARETKASLNCMIMSMRVLERRLLVVRVRNLE